MRYYKFAIHWYELHVPSSIGVSFFHSLSEALRYLRDVKRGKECLGGDSGYLVPLIENGPALGEFRNSLMGDPLRIEVRIDPQFFKPHHVKFVEKYL